MHSTEGAPVPHERGIETCSDPEGHCTVCGDEAIPMRVRAMDRLANTAQALHGERVVEVALDLVDGVAPGDTLLVHQGFAIARLGDDP